MGPHIEAFAYGKPFAAGATSAVCERTTSGEVRNATLVVRYK